MEKTRLKDGPCDGQVVKIKRTHSGNMLPYIRATPKQELSFIGDLTGTDLEKAEFKIYTYTLKEWFENGHIASFQYVWDGVE